MKKKKILYVITLAKRGGAQKYVFDLAKNLDKNKYETVVAGHGKTTDWLFANLEREKIKFHQLKHLQRAINPWHDFLAIFEIKKIIKKFQPDIIHLNSSKAGVLGALAGKKSKAKIIYTVHGFVFNEPLNFIKKTVYLWLEKFSAIYKDNIITVSEFDRQIGIKNKIAPKEKFITIHNGIKTKGFNFLTKEKAREQLNLPEKNSIIGCVANYYPTKALERIIQAAKIITKEYKNAKFVLIGNGPEKKKLQEQIEKLGLSNNFFLGPVSKAISFLKAFDVFVLPSVKEGLPYTILESMLAEIPIIATRVGGIDEIITNGENGFLVLSDKKTAEQIAEKTIYYLKNPQIASIFTNKAYRKLLAEFTIEKMIKKTEALYE